MVSNQDRPNKHPFYSVHSDLDSFILYNDGGIEGKLLDLETDLCDIEENKTNTIKLDEDNEPLWNMDFEWVVSKQGLGAGLWVFKSQTRKSEIHINWNSNVAII